MDQNRRYLNALVDRIPDGFTGSFTCHVYHGSINPEKTDFHTTGPFPFMSPTKGEGITLEVGHKTE